MRSAPPTHRVGNGIPRAIRNIRRYHSPTRGGRCSGTMLQPLEEPVQRPRRSAVTQSWARPTAQPRGGGIVAWRDAVVSRGSRSASRNPRRADFYKPSHTLVLDAIETLFGRAEPADAVSVAEELRRRGVLEEIGGAAVLAALQSKTAAISSTPRYARIVVENALLRRLIGVANEIAEIGYGLPEDVADSDRPRRTGCVMTAMRPSPGD